MSESTIATRRTAPRRRAMADLGGSEIFCRDLTADARNGKFRRMLLRPVVHDQLIGILAKMDKPTAVLVGDGGVGKSCNVYALAHWMVHGDDVPEDLRSMRLLELEIPALLAGAGPGDLERRALAFCRDAAAAGRGVVVFIDECHNLMDARVGALSLGEIFKPALARGELCCIAATTREGYRHSFETDPALARRFQRVDVPEPGEEETLAILSRSVPGLARSHGMLITEKDLRRAVSLSRRYLRHRSNPDKSNDLLDEAMALQRVEFEKNPALRGESIARAREAQRVAETEGRADEATRHGAVANALEQGDLPLDERYLGRVIHRWTGIPTEVLEGDAGSLWRLESRMLHRVVGQDGSIRRLTEEVVRGLTGVKRAVGPIASALLVGPTGVGKTETARGLSAELLGDPKAFLRIDGSEFVEPHSVARLIGSPPGYVGFDQGGILTGFVRDHPFGVILLDEFEKAHRNVHDTFLQIMEEGSLEDGRGIRVDFSGHVVLFTSNLDIGAARQSGFDPTASAASRDQDLDESALRARLTAHLRPEFVNRIDLILQYRRLTPDDIRKIVGLLAEGFQERMCKERELQIEIAPEVLDDIAAAAYHPASGGRQARREFERVVGSRVSAWLLENRGARGRRITFAAASEGK